MKYTHQDAEHLNKKKITSAPNLQHETPMEQTIILLFSQPFLVGT
jgi:hypothetical protein